MVIFHALQLQKNKHAVIITSGSAYVPAYVPASVIFLCNDTARVIAL